MIIWLPSARPDQIEVLKGLITGVPLWKGATLDDVDETIVVAMGARALDWLKAQGAVPKKASLASLRGQVIEFFNKKLLISYDPFLVNLDYERKCDLIVDLKLARRLTKTGSIEPALGDYEYVDSFKEVFEYVDEQYDKTGIAVPVSFDTETIGLNPYAEGVYIISAQASHKPGRSCVIRFSEDGPTPYQLAEIRTLLTSPRVKLYGTNAKFDLHWIKVHWDIDCTNLTLDTTLLGSLLDENRRNDLNLHAKLFTDIGGYDDALNEKYDKGRMDLVPPDELLPYAGGDTDAALQVGLHFKNELLEDAKLANFYVNLLHPAQSAVLDMEIQGVCLDREYLEGLGDEVEAECKRLHDEMLDLLPMRLRNKYAGKLDTIKPALKLDYFFTPYGLNLKPKLFTDKKKEPSTSLEHLRSFRDHDDARPFIELLEQSSSASKTLSTYIVGFLKHLRADGRLHPSYMLHRGSYKDEDAGTNTGRLSAKDPAIQTVPKHTVWAKKLRKAYPAPPGFEILAADYSQGELRVLACIANEIRMIEAYLKGMDLHLISGAEVLGIPIDEAMLLEKTDPTKFSHIRQVGKRVNFGLIYGMSPKGYAYYSWVKHQVMVTDAEAEATVAAFYEAWPGLPKYHDRQRELARAAKQVRSPLGRLRRLPLVDSTDSDVAYKQLRRAINAPIQSTLSDLTLLAITEISRKLKGKVWPTMMVHDQLVTYVKEGTAEELAPELAQVMENLPLKEGFGWSPQLPFVVDCEFGPTLGDLQKVVRSW